MITLRSPTHTPISLLPSKLKTAVEAVCKHTLKQTNSYRTERACTGYGENPTRVHLFKIRTSTQNFVFPQVSDHHPAPTDSELSCTCCCQSSQIQSHHSHPSVSALVKDKYKLFFTYRKNSIIIRTIFTVITPLKIGVRIIHRTDQPVGFPEVYFIRSFMLLTVMLIIISFPSHTLSFQAKNLPSSANPSHRSPSFSSSGLTQRISRTAYF